MFLVVIRLWSVSHVRGFVTPADFVRSRFDSPTMALLVAITGIVATMPYIALQLVGIEAILKAMGVEGDLPLIVAFIILAIYTYNSGLRAPALIAFVKDTLIYLTIIVAVIVIPSKLGGWDAIFGAAEEKFSAGSGRDPARRPASWGTRRWRWARRWRCSSTRTRSPGCWRPATATCSSGT